MTTLVIAEHDNAQPGGRDPEHHRRRRQDRRRRARAGRRRQCPRRGRAGRAGRQRVQGAAGRRAAAGRRPGREPGRPGAGRGVGLQPHPVPRHRLGQERGPARGRQAGCGAGLDIIGVESADTFQRPIYAGNAIATVQSADAVKVITVRTTGFDAVAATGGSAAIEDATAVADSGLSSFVGREVAKSDRPELAGARVVVSGGRGLGSAENFKILTRWPTSWARRWALRARRSTPATRRTTGRSARPARSWPRSCTWPSASPAPSSTWPA